ncbi:hypothetical protein ACFOEQ_17760 [Chryseobacterium arachidis]
MLVTGNVKKDEYSKLVKLVEKIDKDDFSKKYFIGISKDRNGDYNLLTSEGNYKVEIGDLDNIELKVKGFKAFVEKYLVYQDPEKYSMVSIKYQNQIVTTLNPYFKENDSILKAGNKELAKAPASAPTKKAEAEPKPKAEIKKETKKTNATKTKAAAKPKESKKTEKSTAPKPKTKAKVKIE